jgi:hypothetical protein
MWAEHPYFEKTIIILILINTVILASETSNETEGLVAF